MKLEVHRRFVHVAGFWQIQFSEGIQAFIYLEQRAKLNMTLDYNGRLSSMVNQNTYVLELVGNRYLYKNNATDVFPTALHFTVSAFCIDSFKQSSRSSVLEKMNYWPSIISQSQSKKKLSSFENAFMSQNSYLKRANDEVGYFHTFNSTSKVSHVVAYSQVCKSWGLLRFFSSL